MTKLGEVQKQAEANKKKEETETPWKKMNWKEKYKFVLSNITVEPTMICYVIPCVLASLATQNLNVEKACRVNLAYPKHVCDALSIRDTANYTKEEAAVQKLVASMGVWKSILQSALPAFLILFVGSWSDRWGLRKPCILLPIFGELLTVISLMFCTYFFDELPMEVAGFAEGFFPAVTGGWFTMFLGIFSYIGDVTSIETRTLRIGIVNIFVSLGIPIGSALSGVLLKKIGFYGVFGTSAVMYIMGLLNGYYKVHEPKKVDVPELSNKPCAFIRDFFDLTHITETFNVAFKKGEGNRRTKVLLLMLVVMVIIGPMHGEMVVQYLFTRFRFNWDEVDYSIFSTYSVLLNLIGTSISVGIFSHMLKVDDAFVGIYSCMSKILASFIYGFATTALVFYLGPVVDILNGTSFIAMRSIASKLVSPEELGKINSLFGVAEALMPLVYGPMYSATYAATIRVMPGAFYILGGILTTPAVVIFGWMYIQNKKEAKEKKNTKDDPEKTVDDSVFKDVILTSCPKQSQVATPIVKAKNINGVDNTAFEIEKEKY